MDGIVVEEGRLQKKKRKTNRKSKSDKKKIGKSEENEESCIHLIQAEYIRHFKNYLKLLYIIFISYLINLQARYAVHADSSVSFRFKVVVFNCIIY